MAILKNTPINNEDKNCMRILVKLLSIPLEKHSLAVLSMNQYPALMQYMNFANKRVVSLKIVKSVLKTQTPLNQ